MSFIDLLIELQEDKVMDDTTKEFKDLTNLIDNKVYDEDLEMLEIPITDPLNGATDTQLEEGEQLDIGQILVWSKDQITKLQSRIPFYYDAGDSPITLLCIGKNYTVGEASTRRFDTFHQLIDTLKKQDCIVYQIIQNNTTGKFALRYFGIPAGFDYELHHKVLRVYNAVLRELNDHKPWKPYNGMYGDVFDVCNRCRTIK